MSNIFMMGDSTMKFNNYYSYPQCGWGQGLELFVKEGVLIFNHAENGRSTKSFIDEGRFDKILKDLKKGDYVICSFGHNDEKKYDPLRYTDPFGEYQKNLGYFAKEVENTLSSHRSQMTKDMFKDFVKTLKAGDIVLYTFVERMDTDGYNKAENLAALIKSI